jgi:uncharacterized protein (DUF433 family)
MKTTFRTSVHGRIIELPWDLGLPEGHVIEVSIKTCPDVEGTPEPPLPWWLERLGIDPTVEGGKYIVKGTRVLADTLVEELEGGKNDQELLLAHAELTSEDLAAVREYAKLPLEMRRSFGAWAEKGEELDIFLEWNRQQRKLDRREIDE